MKGSTAVLLLAGSVALCGGCARGASLPAELPTDVPYAYHLQTASGGDGALLEGTLELQDGCLVVVPSSEGVDEDLPPVVPVLPIAVTTWDGTTLEVNGVSAAAGDHISLGGGFGPSLADAEFVPAGCPVPATEPDEANYFSVGIN